MTMDDIKWLFDVANETSEAALTNGNTAVMVPQMFTTFYNFQPARVNQRTIINHGTFMEHSWNIHGTC